MQFTFNPDWYEEEEEEGDGEQWDLSQYRQVHDGEDDPARSGPPETEDGTTVDGLASGVEELGVSGEGGEDASASSTNRDG